MSCVSLNDEVLVSVVVEKSELGKIPHTVREERPETELLSWTKRGLVRSVLLLTVRHQVSDEVTCIFL